MKRSLLFLYIALCCLFSFNRLQSQSLILKNYSKNEGLSDVMAHCVLQDSRGFIWFGTSSGLNRFDGVSFTIYKKKDGLPVNTILSLLEYKDGEMWVGTSKGGAVRFDGQHFTVYSTGDGLAGTSVRGMVKDGKGGIWFGTSKGLSRFHNGRFTSFFNNDNPRANNITDVIVDKDDQVWVGTTRGLFLYKKGKFFSYKTIHPFAGQYVIDLYYDSKYRLWMGGKNGMACMENGNFKTYTQKDGLPHNSVNSFVEDKKGNILVGTWNGISRFTANGLVNYNSQNGLPNNFINALLFDGEGNLWIATYGGVSRLNSFKIDSFSSLNSPINNIVRSFVQQKNGTIWIATGAGLFSYQNGTFNSFYKKDGLICNDIVRLYLDKKETLWIATPEGISRSMAPMGKDRGLFENFTTKEGLSSNINFFITQDSKGNILAGNRKGADRLQPGKSEFTPFLPGVPAKNSVVIRDISGDFYVQDIMEDSTGVLWFSANTGLYRYHNNQVSRLTTQNGLLDNYIRTVYQDSSGNIWVGTKKGVSVFNPTNPQVIKNYSTQDGLSDNHIFFILEDLHKTMWMGTGKGITSFDGQTFRTFTRRSHGFIADLWLGGFRDNRGRLWMGSSQGLLRLQPPLEPYNSPPPVYISTIKILEKEIPLTSFKTLDYRQNHIRIDFAGLSLHSPQSVSYKYRLKSGDAQWLETSDNSLFFSYLPPGDYRFQVKAVSHNGIESTEHAEFGFDIRPPFWKTSWFLLLLAVVMLSLMMFLVSAGYTRAREKAELKSRTRQLVMSQRMELMGMLAGSAVHDLKNLLAIIIGYSEIVAEQFQPEDENYQYNKHITSTANTAVKVVKQILAFSWQKQDKESLVDLVALMDDILEILKVTTPAEIVISWQPPGEEILYAIDPTHFQQLIMNLSINAVHAMPDGGQLTIDLGMDREKTTVIKIADTGIGIPEDIMAKIYDPLFTTKKRGSGSGLGLFVVKQIMDEYQGKIKINSNPGKGTCFTLLLYNSSSNRE